MPLHVFREVFSIGRDARRACEAAEEQPSDSLVAAVLTPALIHVTT